MPTRREPPQPQRRRADALEAAGYGERKRQDQEGVVHETPPCRRLAMPLAHGTPAKRLAAAWHTGSRAARGAQRAAGTSLGANVCALSQRGVRQVRRLGITLSAARCGAPSGSAHRPQGEVIWPL